MNVESRKDVSVLVVGSGSMLGRSLLGQGREGLVLEGVSHADFEHGKAAKYDVIVNMAYDPRYMREAYHPGLDFDLKVAQAVAEGPGHFFMMSSRKVYGSAGSDPIREDAVTAPVDPYGRNKRETEKRIESLLGSRCTILRLANVFDFEPSRHTFFGMALTSLRRDKRILLDVNPFVKKDFIPLTDCMDAIRALLSQRPSGLFNLGYGTATEIGRIAMWLIEGYGQGELVVNSTEERDGFLLDIGKLTALIGAPGNRKTIRERCLEIGEHLRHA
jgi:UDP-glucose 4-epimerase